MAFWDDIHELRRTRKIPRQWSRSDLQEQLRGRYRKSTISSVPSNQSITVDGLVKGDYVKRGRPPMAYRVGKGRYELIDDPENEVRQQKTEPSESVRGFRFLSPDGAAATPNEWLQTWSAKYPSLRFSEDVYKYLLERSTRITKEDFLVLGAWKDRGLGSVQLGSPPAAINPRFNRRWSPKATGVAYEVWTDLADTLASISTVLP